MKFEFYLGNCFKCGRFGMNNKQGKCYNCKNFPRLMARRLKEQAKKTK